jgi:hypothetical protein
MPNMNFEREMIRLMTNSLKIAERKTGEQQGPGKTNLKCNTNLIPSRGLKQISAMEEAQLLFTAQGKMCDDDPAPKTQGCKSRIIQAPDAVLRL